MNTFQIVRLIGEAPKELLNFTETSLLTRMAFFGNKDGKDISPGIKKLLSETKLSRSSLIRSLNSLTKKNVLIPFGERSAGSHDKVSYHINIKLLEELRVPCEMKHKSYSSSLNLKISHSGKQEIVPISGVTMTPEAGVTLTPDNNENINHLVSHRHQTGVTMTPEAGVTLTPLPYIQLLEPNTTQSIVELKLDAVLAAVEKKPKKISKEIKSWTPQVMEVFEHWKIILNHKNSKLDDHRRKYIVRALEAGYKVDELKLAIEGVKKTPHNMGVNDRKKVYDDFDVIFRNSKQVERFIRNFDTIEAPINKNIATGLKLGFIERQKSQVNMLKQMGDKYFPHLSDNLKSESNEQGLLKTNLGVK